MSNDTITRGLKAKETTHHADMAAFDELPPELRAVTRNMPIKMACEPPLKVIRRLGNGIVPHMIEEFHKLAQGKMTQYGGIEETTYDDAMRRKFERMTST